jgi:hypothetical protein
MALGSTQPLAEMSTRNISWGLRQPVHRADNLTTFILLIVLKSGTLNFLEHSGPVKACNGIALPLPFIFNIVVTFSSRSYHMLQTLICTDLKNKTNMSKLLLLPVPPFLAL